MVDNRKTKNFLNNDYTDISFEDDKFEIKSIFSENKHDAGIWECGPGKYRLERETDEFFVMISGHWILYGDEGDEYDLKTGDTILLRKGWKGTAHIVETIRKVYIAWE